MQKFAKQAASPASLNWDDVRFFLELARTEKLTATARVLGVEHSTVARRVSALETQLGVRLFDRLPRSWNLTLEGEHLLAHAKRLEDEALAFSRASLGAGSLSGTVRLSAPPALASYFMVPHLAALRGRWPGITLELVGEARQANLYRREADLAIRLSRPEEPGLATRKLASLGFGLYGAAHWARCPAEDWELLAYGDALRDTAQQRWLDQLAAGRTPVFRTNDLAALHQACRAGLGVAILPHFLARGDASLAPLPAPIPPLQQPLWLVIHPDVRRSPRVKAVAELVNEVFLTHAGTLA